MWSLNKVNHQNIFQVIKVRDPLQDPALHCQPEKAKLRGTTFTFDLSSPKSTELWSPGPKGCWTTGNQKNPNWKLAASFSNLSNLSVRENSRCNYLSLKKGAFQQASEYASTPHTTHSKLCSHWNKHPALPINPPPYQTVHRACFPSRLSLTSGKNEARRGSCSIKTPQRPQLTLRIWIGTFHADLD